MNADTATDEYVVRRVLRGDTEAFRIIITRHQGMVYSIGRRFLRNDDDARDFAQEVLIKAFDKLGTFKGSAPFRAWLARIAYNHGINAVKAARDPGTLAEEALESRGATPERSYEHNEIRALLERAVEALPENFRLCLDCYFFYGMPYADICEMTGIPVNTIKSNVFRAKQMLRDALRGTIAEDYHELR
ncbi:MAG TPA: sigma-70 family RNA polymerase sigma factor [Spirochaetota bacterium]|nr:sigma-70 family RNA polymerase sigma factor [Spirochaetota bacterium]HNT12322.1 sigma-70 family RNA polymerase sigma factor [Spirochaetota bacterium]HNV46792.1 sigma-70 family RNA polymerase sigma factor [Spirochaetota bacterium]HOS41605.1 sigma-70 family RNA polymerase sigma factor [Spirochaetota bacterium]HPU89242.1 sigma-70 family RNA polymerase sigma factor [Spirochaetota bacterium]